MRYSNLIKAAAACVCSAVMLPALAGDPGVMVRTLNDGYFPPVNFGELPPDRWPGNGWAKVVVNEHTVSVTPLKGKKDTQPKELRAITVPDEAQTAQANPSGEYVNQFLVRFPNVQFAEGQRAAYVFRNGTTSITPKLDYRYNLTLNGLEFALTVQNGLRNKDGVAYGDAAVYMLEYNGQTYEYTLPGYGWNTRVAAIADIDGDGLPDLLVGAEGTEYLLLSTVAKPDKNKPSATLHYAGCGC